MKFLLVFVTALIFMCNSGSGNERSCSEVGSVTLNDTIIFDIAQAQYSSVGDQYFIEFPVILQSEDPNINAVDYWFQFDLNKLTYVSTTSVVATMDVFSNFNANNQYLSNTSSTTSISVFLPLNVPIMKLKFSLAAPCTPISDADFYSATTLLNGIVSSALFVPENGGVTPEIEVITPDPWCSNYDIEFSYPLEMNGYEIVSYDWDFGNNLLASGQNVSSNYAAGGDYTVTMNAFTTNGCEYEVTKDVQILEGPVAGFTSLFNADQNVMEFTNESSIATGSITDYNWDFGDATFSTDFEPTHTYSNTDLYTVVLTVTSDLGCVDTSSQIVSAVSVGELTYGRIAIDVFPNPTSNEMNLHALESMEFYIVDDAGKRITPNALLPAHKDLKLNVSNLAAGGYTIVGYNENTISRTRFVVMR